MAFDFPMPSYTKEQEFDRSAELALEISARSDHGFYYALMLLLDSGYGATEIRAVADRLLPKPKRKTA